MTKKVKVYSRKEIIKTLGWYFTFMFVVGLLSVLFWLEYQRFYSLFLGLIFVLMVFQLFGGSSLLHRLSYKLQDWGLK